MSEPTESLVAARPRDLIAESRERFLGDAEAHVMEVLHDEGLYRHLRFKKPGTSAYYFDLVTWPGHLSIGGDCGDYVFARTADMFEFFGARPGGARGGIEDARWGINPQYWSEKLQAPKPSGAERYSPETFHLRVGEWYDEKAPELSPDEATALRSALREQVLDDYLGGSDNEHEAHRLLNDFEHDGIRIYDSWEWNFREYDWTFLWCCWAIVWGIGQYRAAGWHAIGRLRLP